MRNIKLVAYRDQNIEDKETLPLTALYKTKVRRFRKIYLLIAILLVLFPTGLTSGYWMYHMYTSDFSLVQQGMQHIRSAVTLLESLQSQPFALETVKQAQKEFTEALGDVKVINAQLAKFVGVANFTPIYGSRLTAAIHLSVLAMNVSQAGMSGCELWRVIVSRFNTHLSASGLTNADFTAIDSLYQTVKASLDAAINEAVYLTPADLSFDAHLAKLLGQFRANFPLLRTLLAQVDQVLPALPSLLGIGSSAHYLVEILDSTELRPGGGFIGNYAIATVSNGQLTDARVTDTYILDHDFMLAGHSIPFPQAYQWFANDLGVSSWSLRDSNLEADFPTDARYSESIYQREGGTIPLQGVMAITPYFIEQVLDVTGPINMPEYNEVVTSQNLISLIHLHQLGSNSGSDLVPSPDGYSSQRKYFTELLGERLLAQIQVLPSSAFPLLMKDFLHAMQSKDVQVYFNTSAAENILLSNHLADTIESPGGDSLFVVDANVGGDKANGLITSTINDQVTIDSNGNVVHHTTLSYSWMTDGDAYGSSLYQDYVRVYVPTSSSLLSQQGWQSEGSNIAFGRRVWAGFFTLVYGQTQVIILTWTDHSVVKDSSNEWQYHYLLQRQAAIQREVTLQIVLPLCVLVVYKKDELVSQSNSTEQFSGALTEDLNFNINYACK